MHRLVILYDGVCGLCNRLNTFVLRHDRQDRFRFAALQGAVAREILTRHGKDPEDLDTVYVVAGHGSTGEQLLARSSAIFAVLAGLGGPWRALALLRFLPRWLRDRGYDLVARRRYRLFGRHQSCLVPEARYRAKFLDG